MRQTAKRVVYWLSWSTLRSFQRETSALERLCPVVAYEEHDGLLFQVTLGKIIAGARGRVCRPRASVRTKFSRLLAPAGWAKSTAPVFKAGSSRGAGRPSIRTPTALNSRAVGWHFGNEFSFWLEPVVDIVSVFAVDRTDSVHSLRSFSI